MTISLYLETNSRSNYLGMIVVVYVNSIISSMSLLVLYNTTLCNLSWLEPFLELRDEAN